MSRSHETRIEIDAPIEEVWRAITEERELERWFAPIMKVTPGAGGSMSASWGPGMEGQPKPIEVWEPNRHLRVVEEREWTHGCDGSEQRGSSKAKIGYDYFLETTAGGKTLLRLVHSGFGDDASWDGEYEGTKSGWPTFFRTLKHGLERHPGVPCANKSLFHVVPGANAHQALDRLLAASGIQEEHAPGLYLGVIASLNDALITAMGMQKGNDATLYIGLVLYGLTPERVAEVEAQWKQRLEALAA